MQPQAAGGEAVATRTHVGGPWARWQGLEERVYQRQDPATKERGWAVVYLGSGTTMWPWQASPFIWEREHPVQVLWPFTPLVQMCVWQQQ